MLIIDELLKKPSIRSIAKAVDLLSIEFDDLISILQLDIQIDKLLLGADLSKIYTLNVDGKIEVDGIGSKNYHILSRKVTVELENLTTEGDVDYNHSHITQYLLQNYLNKESTFDSPIKKESILNNLVAYKDLLMRDDLIPKSTDKLTLLRAYLTKISKISDKLLITKKIFRENFITKFSVPDEINIEFSNLDTIYLKSGFFKEIVLDYTDVELKGSGCKLSDFNETKKASAPQDQIVEIMVNVLWPDEANTLTINGTDYSYTPSSDDTPDVVADTLGDSIDIDGVSYETQAGYYTASPQDDDNEIKLAWYIEDTTADKSYHVTLQSDNSSEHDLEVNWDADNGQLTVTYASDGSDTIYPTIGDLIDAVESNSPVKVLLVNANYTRDDEYPYEMDFDLDQYDSKLVITSTKEELNITGSPDGLFGINEVQPYKPGIHQEGNVQVVTFRRGYKYYIKIDDTEYDVDTTDNNNPNVNSKNSLIKAFVDLINGGDLANATSDLDKIVLTLKDYNSHTITTSGAIDYKEPLPRDIQVKYDFDGYMFQSDTTKLTKQAALNVTELSRNSVLCKTELDRLLDKAYYASSQYIGDIQLKPESLNKGDDSVATLSDIVEPIYALYKMNPNYFPQKDLHYVSRYDLYVDANLSFPDSVRLQKYGILALPKGQLLNKDQKQYIYTYSIDVLENNLLGFDSNLSTQLNTFGNYLTINNVNSYRDLSTKENTPIKSLTSFVKRPLSNIVTPLAPLYEKDSFMYEGKEIFIKDILRDSSILNGIDFSKVKDADKIKHILMTHFLSINSGDLLTQITDLLDAFYFSPDDIRLYLNNSVMTDVILEMDTDDEAPQTDNNIAGQDVSGTIGFEDLYIRQYKPIYKIENKETDITKYVLPEFFNLSDIDKAFFCLPLKISLDVNTSIRVNSEWNFKKTSVYDDMIYKEIARSGYFPSFGYIADKFSTGNTKRFNDSFWNLLFKGVHIKDDSTVIGVADSIATIRLSFAKYTNIDPYVLAYIFGPSKIWSTTEGIFYHDYALFTWFVKVYESIKRLNIDKGSDADNPWKDYFGKITGILLTNDDSKTDLLPYDLFKIFLSAVGEINYTINAQSTIISPNKMGFNGSNYQISQ